MAKAAPQPKQATTAEAKARYWLLERVAKGGMAELFKARVVGPEGFDKLVAVKRILPDFSENAEFVRMFIDEARLAANLTHPNIVHVFELGRDIDGNLFISMELVHGPELGTILEKLKAKRKRMPEAAALEITIQVLRGLHHAHKKTDLRGQALGLVHRDVSPQNVLVTPEGVAKLLDFGVAKAKGRLTETQAGLVKGKLIYMSPEQSRNKAIDARSDQFAAGLLLWECLAGEPCYQFPSEQFPTEVELLRAIGYGRPRSLTDVGLEVEEELESALMRALEAKADDRFENCEEFANALLRFKQRNYPSFTPTMLGKLVTDTCPKEVERLAALPDLDSKNSIPLKVADLAVSNLAASGNSRRTRFIVLGAVSVGVAGLAIGGGSIVYNKYIAPEPETQQVTVINAPSAVPRTITLTKVEHVVERVEVPAGTLEDGGLLEDGGDLDGGDLDAGEAIADAGEAAADADAGAAEPKEGSKPETPSGTAPADEKGASEKGSAPANPDGQAP